MKPTTSATDSSRRSTRRFIVLAFALAAIGFVVIAAGGINENLVYYWTPKDLRTAGDKAYGATIRLGGMVAPGSIRQRSGSGVEFDVLDADAVVHVKSSGVPPQMFRENIGVVVEGTMVRGGTFESHRLMISHNNKYEAPKGGHSMSSKELEKLMRTTEGM
ncbi:MAG: cytochrome c maturation protein CcmE [Acidobacteriota bacterium]